ncbi:hypothetical protein M409DRAFT_50188 [Zasmidium cellare ATCC 36951]|uniref:Checkpoint protein RAD24-like helical bundle domain-containing protein n=1 Tax=Zasmidium cellare ATCC 36951 TaxID=1080233 RepID=A0A6A6D255_ZASCE|nr:uncharacterized protein M409DRAFT_50188 [Zasmidium cellare ATCC 36951]KAF2172498.1 hypothetical protein M409DRAFT_50188 [Zasmidium cellare ATCC 36951]
MGPRASRRKVATISDDEDENENETHPEEIEQDSPKPQKRSTGKLKSVRKGQTKASGSSRSTAAQDSPQKSKPKVKNSTKELPKPAAKPIYSFFNNATQRQQTSQPSASPEKLFTLHEDVEAIHDDTDGENSHHDESTTPLSKGSSTALAMRKRKFPKTQTSDHNASLAPAASQKFRKTSSGDRVPSLTVLNSDKRPWTDQFAPNDLSELAVHKRKVADVRNWLEATLRGKRQKVLVLKGAAGTGKTTTVQLLAKDLGLEVVEWKDTSGLEASSESFTSTASRFEELVGRAGASGSLVLSANSEAKSSGVDHRPAGPNEKSTQSPQVLLIEEFPNTFSRTSSTLQSFRSTISQYVASPLANESVPTPVVMIISETLLSTNTAAADSFTAHRLLGPELITNPYVNVIEFNAVAPTFLIKALETIVVKEARKSGRRRTPGPQVLKHLAETGDIRSAVSSLEFICLRGDNGDTWSSKVAFTKTKQSKTQAPMTKAEEEALKLISNRESSLGIFHSVGKVVYNKRLEGPSVAQPPAWLPQHRRSKVAETDADTLIDELGTDTQTFLAALHENYALSCSCSGAEETLDSLLGCMENLSDSDLLSLDRFSFGTRAFSGSTTDSLRQDEMCFQVAVRGMLFSLPHPVHRSTAVSGNRRDAHQMFYPTSLRLWRKKEEIEGKIGLLAGQISQAGETGGTKPSGGSSVSGSGVESWKQNSNFKSTAQSTDGAEDPIQPQLSTEAKNELLMDRLPYMTHILGSSKPSRASRNMVDRLLEVTRISGAVIPDDEETEPEESQEPGANVEQWSTDRPDAEAGTVSTSPKKQRIPSKQNAVFEAVSIPVEPRVDKLVLEDDDIVDD